MLSKTLEQGLRSYGIGEKLRSLRLGKKLGLVQLGKHSGLSPALLSKLERGQLFPTLPTLLRIAMVYSVGLEYFFEDSSKRHVLEIVRGKDRIRLPESRGRGPISYRFESLDFPASERKMDSYKVEFQPLESPQVKVHQHLGAEFIYVVSGRLELRVEGREHVLEPDDSVYFDSSVAHGYRSLDQDPCAGIVVTVS